MNKQQQQKNIIDLLLNATNKQRGKNVIGSKKWAEAEIQRLIDSELDCDETSGEITD